MPGATVVNSFAQGVAALKAGKQIRYEGPGGPTSFDAYHDSTGLFQVDRYTRNGTVKVTANLSTSRCARSACNSRMPQPPRGGPRRRPLADAGRLARRAARP